VIALTNSLEGQLWRIILDAFGYDEDTHYFLREIRQRGILEWAKQRAVAIESDLVLLRHTKGVAVYKETVRDATILRRLLGILAEGKDSGPYLGPGDARLKEKQVIRCCHWCPDFKSYEREPKWRATCCIRCPIYEDCRRDPRRDE